MDLVKLEINGKRVIAESRQTILEVARQSGMADIPTLCHDGQLEPFAACFICVVKVKGARTLLPACSTRVAAGMVVETETAEIRRARKASLELMLSNHFADCIGPCQLECPAGIDIQGYIALAALGKYRDAIALIKERNPLPAICGRVCTRPCEVRGCRRNLLDEAVGIDYIKRYLADLDLGQSDPWRPSLAELNGQKVAVIGAGPAGLSCAFYLAIRGYEVKMFEGMPEAGGMLRYGIPEYRLPKEVLDLEINQILDLGVSLSTNVTLGQDFTIASLKEEGFDAIFVGIGAWESSKMRVKDEDSEGVLPGIEFLREYGLNRARPLRGRVLVVGGGNTAIDCARTALRMGAEEVRLLYRRTRKEMPANEMEIDEAEHEGVAMDFLTAPVRVVKEDGRAVGLECIRMELGEPDASGRRSPKPIPGSEYSLEADSIIAAIGQSTLVKGLVGGKVSNFLPFGETLNLTRWNTIQVNDETFESSVEGVFAGGDVVTGAATAIEAIATGRKAAYAIDSFVRTGTARPEPRQFNSRKDIFRQVSADDLPDGSRYARRSMPTLPIEERIRGFAEVETGYSATDLRMETGRCLECGCVALFDCDLRRFATEYGVEVKNYLGEAKQYRVDRRHPLIELDPNKCILCGRCVRICAEVVGVAAFGFINRGFNTVVKPAMGESLLDTDCVSCGLCIGTCPTGAVTQKLPLVKPGPWPTASVPTVCSYCGVGCRISYDAFGDTLVKASRREEEGPTSGNHCRKGRFGYQHIQSEDRLRMPRIRAGRELQEEPIPEAVHFASMRLKELLRRYTGDQVAVFVSPRLTNEEIYLAQKLARVALNTHQISTFAHLVNRDLHAPEVVSTAVYREVEDAQVIVVVNSELDEEHFVVDLMVKKAIRKGGKLVYIGPRSNQTSRFADLFLRCKEGDQARVVLALLQAYGEITGSTFEENTSLRKALKTIDLAEEGSGLDTGAIRQAAELLARSILKVVVFNRDYRGHRTPGDVRLLAEAAESLGASILALREKANMQGLLDMGASPEWFTGYRPIEDGGSREELEKQWCVSLRGLKGAGVDLAEKIRRKEIKVAVVLGEDPLGDPEFPADLRDGLCAADFIVVGDVVLTETAKLANVVLPLSTTAETDGTLTNQARRVQRVRKAIPPVAGMETWQILCALGSAMGFRFKMKYSGIEEVQEEIRRVAPLYADVAFDSADGDGIWATAPNPLPRVPFDYSRMKDQIRPTRTRHLDCVEAGFERWFESTLEQARRVHRDAAREAQPETEMAGSPTT